MRSITITGTVLIVLACVSSPHALAAKWQTVVSDPNTGERIEIDKSRIARVSKIHLVAWSRLVLSRSVMEEADSGADGKSKYTYTSIQALNRYDCETMRFATVKRVYLQGDMVVREEPVARPKEINAIDGSIDASLLNEACKPRTVGEMKNIAEAAGKLASEAQSSAETSPKAMHADMRSAEGKMAPSARSTADTRAPAPVAPPPAKLELPSKAELAAKAAAEKSLSKPEEKTVEKATSATQPASSFPYRVAPHTTVAPHTSYVRTAPRVVRKKAAPIVAETSSPAIAHNIHWSYEGEGAPANWGKLKPDYAVCATGKRQSPIDIRDSIRVDLEPIKFDYKNTLFRILDNGHTVQVTIGPASTITVMGRQFELQQIHFHRPSEERINGRAFDMVAHLVHKDFDNNLAVIAVLLEKGAENPLIQAFWNYMPLEVDQEIAPSTVVNISSLLPENRAYYTYMGSLTTPPCTENVLWMVIKQPVRVSQEQIAIFARLYRNNTRPVQPSNNRLVKETR